MTKQNKTMRKKKTFRKKNDKKNKSKRRVTKKVVGGCGNEPIKPTQNINHQTHFKGNDQQFSFKMKKYREDLQKWEKCDKEREENEARKKMQSKEAFMDAERRRKELAPEKEIPFHTAILKQQQIDEEKLLREQLQKKQQLREQQRKLEQQREQQQQEQKINSDTEEMFKELKMLTDNNANNDDDYKKLIQLAGEKSVGKFDDTDIIYFSSLVNETTAPHIIEKICEIKNINNFPKCKPINELINDSITLRNEKNEQQKSLIITPKSGKKRTAYEMQST